MSVKTVNEHIQIIYEEEELQEIATIRNFRIVQRKGSREIEREVSHYNLNLILPVGYRVNLAEGFSLENGPVRKGSIKKFAKNSESEKSFPNRSK